MYKQIKNYILENKKLLAMTFVLGVAMPYVMAGNLKADISNPYENNGGTVEETIVEYHLVANLITDTFIMQLMYEVPDVSYVADDQGCESGNASTYCLAVALNENLVNFEKALVERKDEVTFESKNDGDEESEDLEIRSLEDAIAANAQQQGLIDEEITAARDAVDLTLAVYNQIQTVYPLHVEFENLIGNLETYNENLAAIRNSIENFPAKFNDASTVSCQ